MRPWAWVLLALALPACGRDAGPAGVLIVTVDALRPDAIGAYGGRAGATPALDALAREAVRFEDAITPAPLSLSAHASLLSGLDPRRHGAREDRAAPLGPGAPLLGERLAAAGWRTAAAFSGSELGPGAGLERGFEGVDAPPPPSTPIRVGPATRRADVAVTRALADLGALAETGRPFLYALQLVDPRPPFEAAGVPRDAAPERRYAAAVAAVDAELGRLFGELRERGLWDRLIVVVTAPRGVAPADGGTMLGEDLSEDALRVPLLVKAPGLEPAVVPGTVSLVDVAPTVLALVGLDGGLAELDGASLLADGALSAPPGRALAVECLHARLGHGAAPWVGVVRDELKLVRGARLSMLDRRADPSGERELYRERDARSEGMRAELERRFGPPDADDARRADPAGLGPRIARLREAEAELAAGRAGPAEAIVRGVLEEAPEDAWASALAASILLGLPAPGAARLAEAEPLLERLLAARPDDPVALELEARRAAAAAALLRREVASARAGGHDAAAASGERRLEELRARQVDALRRALAREPGRADLARALEAAGAGN